jgi:sigma-E factor negative regulatory protein RseC
MNERIEHDGIISRLDEGKAWVTIVQSSACAGCHTQSMCQISGQKEKTIEIPCIDDSFHAGDQVLIIGSSSLGLQAVFYAFAIPLVLIVFMLIISFLYFNSETFAALVTIVVLVAYYFVLYMLRDKLKRKFVFRIKKKI